MTQGYPKAERLATGLGLAVVGGFLDTYTYFTRGGVFANAQTGNLVLLGISAARGELYRAGQYLIPVLAFALGVVATEGLRARRGAGDWQRTVLLLEAAILTVVGLLPPAFPDFVVNVTVSFLCSMQVNSFRLLEGMPYATTMCTGNLRSCAYHLGQRLFAGERAGTGKAARYLWVMLAFCAGAALGVPATQWAGGRAVWLCVLPLLLVRAWLGYQYEYRS
ncbi:MAG: DUF1275 domain-containing protein [Angelakisella sp.]|nr:DUF1275 domain-containing protein [Angelakisella sp.]